MSTVESLRAAARGLLAWTLRLGARAARAAERWTASGLRAGVAVGLVLLLVVAGVLAGMFGIGGGLVIVPGLLYFLKLKELEAIGTSLAALVPPVGLLGAIEYYRNGHVKLQYAGLIAATLFVGAYFGAKIMMPLPPELVRRLYAIFLLVVATRMLVMGQ